MNFIALIFYLYISFVVSAPSAFQIEVNNKTDKIESSIIMAEDSHENVTASVIIPPEPKPSIQPVTTSNPVTTTIINPNSTTTSTTTTTTKPTVPTKPTNKPTSTTTEPTTKITPSTSVAPASTAAPEKTTQSPHEREFDGPSFLGGIILAAGLAVIGGLGFKFYKTRTERNYHTLDSSSHDL